MIKIHRSPVLGGTGVLISGIVNPIINSVVQNNKHSFNILYLFINL